MAVHRIGKTPDRGATRFPSPASGITLVELLVAIAIIALMTAISWPSFTRGLDGIRLRAAMDSAGTFLTEARLESARQQRPVFLQILPEKGQLRALIPGRDWNNAWTPDDRLRIVFPKESQSYVFYPGQPPPRVQLRLSAEDGSEAGVTINVFTGVPEEWKASVEP